MTRDERERERELAQTGPAGYYTLDDAKAAVDAILGPPPGPAW